MVEPFIKIELEKFGFVSYLTLIMESAFDFDHITTLWFVTSPLAIPYVIIGSVCLAFEMPVNEINISNMANSDMVTRRSDEDDPSVIPFSSVDLICFLICS